MNKAEIQDGMRVSVSGMGRGTVIDLRPDTQFFVNVKFDMDAKKFPGQEKPIDVQQIKALPPPKPTRQEKETARYDVIRKTPESYYIAGIIAVGPANIHVSTPPSQFQTTQDELTQHGVEWDESTLTQSTDRTQGRSISVTMPNHGMADEYEKLTGVRSTPYQGNASILSLQSKQFVLNFLLDDLKFKLGKNRQNVAEIRQRVPQEFVSEFDRGVDVALGESLMQKY